ncbi:MAG TPA: hypothetical protein VE990_17845 [Acidimicrobiales bacterium]|nr:hypothetical protein [Acidimicrobiales bacterium]
MTGPSGWTLSILDGDPGALLDRPVSFEERSVTWCRARSPALVLGSAQPAATVDSARLASAGLPLVRRASGGGAVLVGPAEVVWVEVVLPRGDRHWVDDVSRSGLWLGRAWAVALSVVGPGADAGAGAARAPVVHRGPMVRNELSGLICFAGVAAGEVVVGGRKAVGISQRRGRRGARFQCAALLRWDPEAMAGLLAGDDRFRTRSAGLLETLAAPLAGVAEEALVGALVEALPA